MNHGTRLLVYPVTDMDKAKTLFCGLLGVDPYVDAAYYAGFKPGDLEIGLDPRGRSKGPIGYWEVDDIRASLQQLIDAGAQPDQDVRDVGGGKLIATVMDADGNTVGLMQSP